MENLKEALLSGSISLADYDQLFDELVRNPVSNVHGINLAEFPQLKLLCWNYHLDTITAVEALCRYEHHWNLVDEKALTLKELALINLLNVDKTIYLELYPYKQGNSAQYLYQKLLRYSNKTT